jgi:hypothetical protein
VGVVDFKEIPSARGGQAGQDEWPLFAREFFAALGIDIEEGPDRGPDSGRDLVIVEKRRGLLGSGQHRWLVSCKHFAHSNKSVSIKDEPDIVGRVARFKAHGFIGFYSTIPSAELNRTLESYKSQINIIVYDSASIERMLMSNRDLKEIFRRFFPRSFKEYRKATPSTISDTYIGLYCNVCRKDLLKDRDGIVAFAEEFDDKKKIARTLDMYWACKGQCDRALEIKFEKRGLITSWEDISDLIIPMVFMKWVITAMNSFRQGTLVFTDPAYEKFTEFTFAVAQLIVRETTDEERERIEVLRDMPAFLGGLGGWGPH